MTLKSAEASKVPQLQVPQTHDSSAPRLMAAVLCYPHVPCHDAVMTPKKGNATGSLRANIPGS